MPYNYIDKMKTKKKTLRIKVISMGNAEVGKVRSKTYRDVASELLVAFYSYVFFSQSCIIKRYCEKRFVHKYLTTIGIDYGVTK